MTILQDSQQTAAQRTHWFAQERFGVFIHWGPYSVAGRHEWVKQHERLTDEEYQKYIDHFDPDLYDPVQWARLVKEAGIRYAVITTKHHDGFCMWDSRYTEYKVTNSPAGRDLLRPWVEAFRAAGLRIGFYHSLLDWHHPQFTIDGLHPQRANLAFREQERDRDMQQYVSYLHAQVRELLTTFAPVDIFWPDFSYTISDWGWSKGKGKDDWQAEQLVRMIRELAPDILLNNRMQYGADFATPEDIQPLEDVTQPDGQPAPCWEVCHTMTEGSWGYDRDNLNWKTPDLVVRLLIDAVSKGGNMMLNLSPNGRGELDSRAEDMLHAIGKWMRLHNRSIYGAGASDFTAPRDCRLTQRGDRLYLHIFNWPFKVIYLQGPAEQIHYAQMLHDASEVRLHTSWHPGQHFGLPVAPGDLLLELPRQRPDVLVPVVELFLKQ